MSIQKILIISAHYYPSIGGTITHTEKLCEELSNLGYMVTLITEDRFAKDRDIHDANQPYRVIRVKTNRIFCGDTFFPILVSKRLNQYIQEIKPDIINISTGNYVPLYLKFSKKQDIPIVYTVHNVPPEEYIFNISKNTSINTHLMKIYFKLIAKYYRICIKYGRYDHIISVSDRTKERLLVAGAQESDISIVSNGIAKPKLERSCSEKDDKWFTILVTAGIVEHKGQYDLLQSFGNILKVIPQARCILAGPIRSEAYAEKIRNFILDNNYADKVILAGKVTEDELDNLYAKCDLYIQPSYQEGFCIAIMEAMIREKPVIGTAVGAIPELLADGRGIVIESPNQKLIFDAVLRMYSDKEFRIESARKAKEYVMKEYAWSRVAEDTVNVYLRVLENYVRL